MAFQRRQLGLKEFVSRPALYVMDYSKFPSTSLVLMHAAVLRAIAAAGLLNAEIWRLKLN